MDMFIQLTLVGLTTGTIYGIVALGFSIIFTSSSVLNFAQGDFVMVGGISAALIYGATGNYVLATGGALLAGLLTAGVVYLAAVRPLLARSAAPITIVIATLALAITIEAVMQQLFGPSIRYMPPIIEGGSLKIFGAAVGIQNLLILVLTVPLVFFLWWFLYKTRSGLDVRAVGIDRSVAELLGVKTRRITMGGFLVSGVLGALAGVLLTPILGMSPTMGVGFSVTGFIAAVVGGITNPFAALAGGIVVGLIEVYVSGYFNSSFTAASVFLLLPAILLLRPDGLFARKVTKKR